MNSKAVYTVIGDYRYRIKDTGNSSHKFGPCEVCYQPCSTVYLQVEQRHYVHGADSGWTHYGCHDYFGHEQCLIGKRVTRWQRMRGVYVNGSIEIESIREA